MKTQTLIIHQHPDLLHFFSSYKKEKILWVRGQNFAFDFSKIASDVERVTIPAGLLTPNSIRQCLEQVKTIPTVILATGGGRILDAAKLMILSAQWARPRFIAIPTTAGSGSEATPFAVQYVNNAKQSVESANLLPDKVVLSPFMLQSLPAHQRADSGMDAIAQAIESHWNVRADAQSGIFAMQALKILLEEMLPFVKRTTPDTQRDLRMLWGAHLAGKAIAITRTTGCHALSYYLTAEHGVSHGQAVGFFLPLFFDYNRESDLQPLFQLLQVTNHDEAAIKIQEIMKEMGLATRFSDLGLDVDVDRLIQSVNAERFANNPIPFDGKRLHSLILQYLS